MCEKDVLNEEIPFDVIKVIKHDGALEIMSRADALQLAKEMSLDLWLVCEENFPPICAMVSFKNINGGASNIIKNRGHKLSPGVQYLT